VEVEIVKKEEAAKEDHIIVRTLSKKVNVDKRKGGDSIPV